MRQFHFTENRSASRRSVFSFSARAIGSTIATVAGTLFLLLSLAPIASSQDAAEGEITFVAYNLWNYLAMDRRIDGETVDDAPKPDDQIAALIHAISLAAPDILGVCELGDESFLADLHNRLKKIGIDLPHTELVIAANQQNRNLALLSRFPIVARHSRDDLSYRIDHTVLPLQRGILDVVVAPTPGYRLRCVGLHLKSKREVKDGDQALMRRNESQLARDHIDAILKTEPGANLLVYGDFNDTRNEPPIRTLQGRFGTDSYLEDLKLEDRFGFRWTHHWGWADIYARIDFALIARGLSPEIDRERSFILHPPNWDLASDHRALVVRLVPEDK